MVGECYVHFLNVKVQKHAPHTHTQPGTAHHQLINPQNIYTLSVTVFFIRRIPTTDKNALISITNICLIRI